MVFAVADELGVRLFAENDDSSIGLLGKAAIGREQRAAAGAPHRFCDSGEQRGRARKIGIGKVAPALPGDRPAAGLARDAVRRSARDHDPRRGLEWQDALVLEQDQRFAHCLARQGAMFGAADHSPLAGQRARRRARLGEQAVTLFQAQDAAHRLVEPRRRDGPVADLGDKTRVERLPILGNHVDVEPGQQCLRAVRVAAPGQFAVAVPVSDHDPVEAQLAAQIIGEQRAVAVQLDAIDRRERSHRGLYPRRDRRRVRRGVDAPELGHVTTRVAAILAARAAIAEKVLGRRDHPPLVEETGRARIALQAADHRFAQRGHDGRVFRKAFVSPPPAVVGRHRERRGKVPIDPGDRDLGSGGGTDPLDKPGIARGTETDVVRKERRGAEIAMPMNRIGGPQRGYRGFVVRQRRDRSFPVRIGQRQPFARRRLVVAAGPAVAAVEDRAESIGPHIGGRDRGNVGHDQLGDFALERHPRKQRVDPGLVARRRSRTARNRRGGRATRQRQRQ